MVIVLLASDSHAELLGRRLRLLSNEAQCPGFALIREDSSEVPG